MTKREAPKSAPPTEDRRRALREQAFVIAEVSLPNGKVRLGAIDNASDAGVALLLYTHVEVGDNLRIAIELDHEEQLVVEGRVVRRDDVPRDGPWRYRVGVTIDPPSEALRANAERIRKMQERVWTRDPRTSDKAEP